MTDYRYTNGVVYSKNGRPVSSSRRFGLLKRGMDITLSCVLIILSLPLSLLIALIIKIDSKGPVLYKSMRFGQNATKFGMLKFRSMMLEADQVIDLQTDLKEAFLQEMKLKNDPRITPFGRILRKTSLDELPQLFNVLRGEMSLVGPRPKMICEQHVWQHVSDEIFSVKPGMTGLWQVSGRSSLSLEDRIHLDLTYIARKSIRQDIIILLRTLPACLRFHEAA